MKTTGQYSNKRYKCDRCGKTSMQGTNHWGKIYNLMCGGCSWKNGMQPFVTMTCLEKMPKGYKKPEEWKSVKLGDLITKIKKVKLREPDPNNYYQDNWN